MKDEILEVFVTLFFASGFLVPGFILYRTMSLFVVQRSEDIQLFILRFLAYTLFIYLLIFPHVHWIYTSRFYLRHPFWTADYAILLLFALPFFAGIAAGAALQYYKRLRHPLSKLLDRLKLYLLDHETTAWGYQFCRLMEWIDEDGIVMIFVDMKDGRRIVGSYGAHSFASEASEQADIYIEQLFDDDGNGTYTPIPNTKGILLKHTEIASLEFRSIWKPPKETNDDGRREESNAEPAAREEIV